MTGPEGERYHGWWRVRDVSPPHRLEVQDGFADDEGQPNAGPPDQRHAASSSRLDGPLTRMTISSTFPTLDAMEQTLAMGAEEGMREALGQIDHLLASLIVQVTYGQWRQPLSQQ